MKPTHPCARIKEALRVTQAASVAQRMFLVSAMIHADDQGEGCTANMRTLTEYAGITRETGQRALRQYIDRGEIVRTSVTFRGRTRKALRILVGYAPVQPQECDLTSHSWCDPTSQGGVISRHSHLKYPLRRKNTPKPLRPSASQTSESLSAPTQRDVVASLERKGKESASQQSMNADPKEVRADVRRREEARGKRAAPQAVPGFSAERVVSAWNGIPDVVPFSGEIPPVLRTLIMQRINEQSDPKWWEKKFAMLVHNDWIRGRTEHPFSVTLAWLMGPKGWQKLTSGQFDVRIKKRGVNL